MVITCWSLVCVGSEGFPGDIPVKEVDHPQHQVHVQEDAGVDQNQEIL